MEELHKSWGEKVRARRTGWGFSQDRLAEIAGTTQATISRIEKGLQCPSDGLKWKLAGALGETVEHLFPYPAIKPPVPEVAA